MKNFYICIIFLFTISTQAQFSINFDAMSLGNVSPQSPHIHMWPPNPLTDAQVSGVEFYSSPHSMLLRNNNTDDVVVNLGNKTTGIWHITWQMFVPTGHTAYWNIQENENATPSKWNGEFHVGNTASGTAGNITHTQTNSTVAFPHDMWFPVEITVNLDTHKITVLIDGNVLLQNSNYEDNNGIIGNQLGAVNFYSVDLNNTFYIDNFELFETCEYPNITGTNTYPYICSGDTSIITVSHTGQDVYWYDDEVGGNVLGSGSPFVTPILYETTSFWAESQNLTSGEDVCASQRVEVVVNVLAPDMPTGDANQVFQPGETLADLEVTGNNLTWYANSSGTIELPESTPLIHDTTYYVSASEEVCESELFAIHVTAAMNNSEFEANTITIYPNPTQNILHVNSNIIIDKLKIYVITGQNVLVAKVNATKSDTDVSQLAPGLYFVEISSGHQRIVKQFVKK